MQVNLYNHCLNYILRIRENREKKKGDTWKHIYKRLYLYLYLAFSIVMSDFFTEATLADKAASIVFSVGDREVVTTETVLKSASYCPHLYVYNPIHCIYCNNPSGYYHQRWIIASSPLKRKFVCTSCVTLRNELQKRESDKPEGVSW